MTERYKWNSGIQASMQDSQGDVLGPSDIPERLNEQAKRIAELEAALRQENFNSYKTAAALANLCTGKNAVTPERLRWAMAEASSSATVKAHPLLAINI